MRIMSKQQEDFLHWLTELAEGDILIVERALDMLGEKPTVEELVKNILEITINQDPRIIEMKEQARRNQLQ